jgi:heterodisulfide reductase subunit C2
VNPINLTEQRGDFAKEVRQESGQDVSKCYQCGNCTAGCPYTEFFDIPVSQIMRLVQAGQRDTVLNSRSIWLCATCETCTTRCPCEVDVAHIMDTLRIIARRENRVAEKDIKLFYDSFLESMKQYGRMFEMGIIMNYKLRSGHLFGDAELGPTMMGKGKIHLLPKKIRGADKVARIFTRYQEKANKNG